MKTIHSLSENLSEGMILPKGSSDERGNPEAGYFRYNTDDKKIEVFDGTDWANMDYAPSYVTSGLALHFDAGNPNSYGGTGSTWSDLSQGGSDGSITGASYNSEGYFTFDGSNDYVDLGNALSVNTGDFSLSAWVNCNSFSDRGIIAQKGEAGASSYAGYRLLLDPNRKIDFFTNGVNNIQHSMLSSNPVSIDTWSLVTVTRSGSNAKIYLNSALEADSSGADPSSLDSSLDLVIGYNKYGSNWPFSGSISIFKMYSKALSASEVTQNFNANKTRFGL